MRWLSHWQLHWEMASFNLHEQLVIKVLHRSWQTRVDIHHRLIAICGESTMEVKTLGIGCGSLKRHTKGEKLSLVPDELKQAIHPTPISVWKNR